MKNIKKSIKSKADYISARVALSFTCRLGDLMAHAPGEASRFCDVMKRVSDKHRINVNGTEFTFVEACRDVNKNGTESQILRELYSQECPRETRKIIDLMQRWNTCYTLMSLIAMLEENEQLKEEES